MAKPNCPKSDHGKFESSIINPQNGNFKMLAVHCARCGVIVAMADCQDVGSLVQSLADGLSISV